MLDLVTPTFRFLWPFSFLFIDGQRLEVVFHLAQCFLMPSVVAVKQHAQSKDGFSFACCALKFRALSSVFIDDCSDNFNPFKTPA